MIVTIHKLFESAPWPSSLTKDNKLSKEPPITLNYPCIELLEGIPGPSNVTS